MHSGLVLLSALALILVEAWACSYVHDISKAPGSDPLYRIVRDDKVGFMDRQGREVISPRFHHARDFFQGLAVVRVNWKYGYSDTRGNLAIPAVYDEAFDFAEDLVSCP